MNVPYVHVLQDKVVRLDHIHMYAAKAYQAKCDYIVNGDDHWLIYFPIAIKVAPFQDQTMHVHAYLWRKMKCYEVGVLKPTP